MSQLSTLMPMPGTPRTSLHLYWTRWVSTIPGQPGTATIRSWSSAPEKRITYGEAPLRSLLASRPLASDVEAIQVGATGVNVSFRACINARRVEGVFLVKVEYGRWGIKGGSLIWRA